MFEGKGTEGVERRRKVAEKIEREEDPVNETQMAAKNH